MKRPKSAVTVLLAAVAGLIASGFIIAGIIWLVVKFMAL